METTTYRKGELVRILAGDGRGETAIVLRYHDACYVVVRLHETDVDIVVRVDRIERKGN